MKFNEMPRLWKIIIYIPPVPTVDQRVYGKHEALAIVANTMQDALNTAYKEYPGAYINACNDGGHVTHIGNNPTVKNK